MKRWRAFERRVRKRVKRLIKASPDLKKQAKRTRPSQLQLPPLFYVSFFWIFVYAKTVYAHNEPGMALQSLSLVQMAAAAFFVCGMGVRLDGGNAGVIYYPLPDRAYFWWKWRAGVWRTVMFWVLNAFAYTYIISDGHAPYVASAWAAAYGLCAWLAVFPLILLALRRRRLGLSLFLGVVFLTLAFVNAGWPLSETARRWLTHAAVPAGLLNRTFDPTLHNSTTMGAVVACCLLLLIPACLMLLRADARAYAIEVEDDALDGLDWPDALEDADETPERITLSLEDADAHLAHATGWVERCVLAVLNRKDRFLLAYLMRETYGWTRQWRRGLWLMIMAMIGLPLVPEAYLIYPILLAFLGAAAGMPSVGGTWPGLTYMLWHPGAAAFHMLVPLDARAAYGTMLKVNLVRMLCWLPVVLVAGAVCSWFADGDVGRGLLIAFAVVFFLFSLQPVFLMAKIEPGGADFHLTTLADLYRLLVGTVWVVLFIAVGIGVLLGFFVYAPLLASGVLVLPLSLLYAHLRHRRIFHRNREDFAQIG